MLHGYFGEALKVAHFSRSSRLPTGLCKYGRMGAASGLDANRNRPPQEGPATIAKLNQPHQRSAFKLFWLAGRKIEGGISTPARNAIPVLMPLT
jgi:hypothetical protein